MRTEQYELENQIWKDIVGTNGIYQVSNLGRWRRMHKTRGTYYYSLGGLMSSGYLRLDISLNSVIIRRVLMHELVVQTFVRKIDTEKELVHHINQNIKDNRLENLRIETIEQHLSHHHKGKKCSQQSKAKAKATKMKNGTWKKKMSQEQKRKLSELKKGKKGTPHTQQWKRQNSERHKGKIVSQQTKRKISESKKGMKLSPETIAKRTETRRENKNGQY